MAKRFVALICAAFFIPAFAWAGSISGGVLSTTSVGSSTEPTVTSLTFNSTASATANSTAINAALAAGGLVQIYCPAATPVFYIGAPLVTPSHTTLKFYNCRPTLNTNVNGPIIENYAQTQPWSYFNQGTSNMTWTSTGTKLLATLHWPNHNLTVGSWVQVNAAPDTPAWAASTYYDVGIVAIANGNKYQVTTAGTAANSGNGPSGTGTGITDGTAVWSYVSSFGGTASYFWSGAQTAGTQGGIVDTAYTGVFYVQSVTDANNVVVVMRRVPAVTFSGIPLMVRKTDHDIEVDGGQSIFDCNGANQNGGVTVQSVCMILTGPAHAVYRDMAFTNFKKWAVGVEGGANLLFDHVEGSPENTYVHANQNQFLFYGCFDCTVQYVRGEGGDDNVAVNNSAEVPTHYDELWTSGGDVLGFQASHIEAVTGYSGLSIWPIHPAFLMDQIGADHIHVHSTDGNTMGAVRFTSSNVAYPIATPAIIGTIKISDSELRDANTNIFKAGGTNGAVTIHNLIIDNVSVSGNNTLDGAIFLQPPPSAAWIVDNIVVQNSDIAANQTLLATTTNSGTGTLALNNVTFQNNNIIGVYNLFNPSSATNLTTGTFNITGNYINGVGSLVTALTPMNINITNNNLTGGSGSEVVNIKSATVTSNFCGNIVSGFNLGMVRFSAVVSSTVYSCGNNVLSSVNWLNYSSAGTATLYGWDIQCDVTKANRVTGEYCQNTNTAPGSGTLTTAGPVMDQGTSSNSWFLMSNPTGQQY